MDVSIIIVNYKTPELVIDCVNSIKEKTKDLNYEIIVVDNDSQDGSIPMLKEVLRDDIRLIDSGKNLGFGKANNLGAKYASGKYVFLLNSDTVLMNNAIKVLFDYMETHENVGVAGGNLYSADQKPNSSFCLKFDDIETLKKAAGWTKIVSKIFLNRIVDKFYSQEKKETTYYKDSFNFSDKVQKVAYIFGADMMIPKALYDSLGGFDKDFFMYAEEEELSWRITQKGYQIMSVPEAKIIHYDGASVKKDASFSARQFSMRLNGGFMYYFKCFGQHGVHECYRYKLLRLNRVLKIAQMFHRTKLLELTSQQKQCLEEAYHLFVNEQRLGGY